MTLPAHMQRVVEEKAELDERLAKLGAFLDGGNSNTLPAHDRELLNAQRRVMREYSDILDLRLGAAQPAD